MGAGTGGGDKLYDGPRNILYGYGRDGWGESRCGAFVTVGSKAAGGLNAAVPGTMAAAPPPFGKTRGIKQDAVL